MRLNLNILLIIILCFGLLTGCSSSNNADLKSVLIYDVKTENGNTVYSIKMEKGGEMDLTLIDKNSPNLIVNKDDTKENSVVENIDYAKSIKAGTIVDVWLRENTNEIIRMEVKQSKSCITDTVKGIEDSGKKYGKLKIFTYNSFGKTKNIYVSEDMVDSLKTADKGKYCIKYDTKFNLLISIN